MPRPFLKWVGGKRQLLGELLPRIDRLGAFGRYHEPFVGGGALFFELARTGRLPPRRKARLSDLNPNLLRTYQGVQANVEAVIGLLREHEQAHGEAYFYEVRAEAPESLEAHAARIIYLNKTCYNGLYRENSKGKFNAPFGRYKNPLICDEANLEAVSKVLRTRATLQVHSFEVVQKHARAGDLVYFDPPYVPVSATADFTAYAKGGFGLDKQQALADVCRALDAKGVHFLLSNSNAPLVHELYAGFEIEQVKARRAVNSRADRRGAVYEVLVRNFDR